MRSSHTRHSDKNRRQLKPNGDEQSVVPNGRWWEVVNGIAVVEDVFEFKFEIFSSLLDVLGEMEPRRR